MAGLPKEIVLTLPGFPDPALAIAAARAGALGVLDLEYVRDSDRAAGAFALLSRHARGPFGARLDADDRDFFESLLPFLPDGCRTILLTGTDPGRIASAAAVLRERGPVAILLEVREVSHAARAREMGAQGIVAKGHEAGGRVGDETSFILLQRLLATDASLPIWVQGGIGPHTAAACAVAGAAGIVLDWQLALTREGVASIPESLRARVAAMDGSETVCLGATLPGGAATRMYSRPGARAAEALQELDTRIQVEERSDAGDLFRDAVGLAMREASADDRPWLTGQDAAFAPRIASRFRTAGAAIEGFRHAIASHVSAAQSLRSLDEDSPLARSHGTRYPILQGPMTRVSDVAPFAHAVAEGGALPFLALALMRGAEVKRLMEETRARLGERPWGVGILGFVPLDLRKEQLEAIREIRPPFALIAGGRPDQARALEREGIATYLHVPSPGLLEMFLADGARRFVFEGRECGGHVGPRSSFVLWETMVELLLRKTPAADFERLHVVFAGGIHDARSAAMVAALAAPLAEAGARIGVLLGTAYLFTREAVSSGAIQPGFQEEARACRRTVLLETGPGHATRCVDTAFAREFLEEKRRLLAQGRSAEEIRDALEMLNLGRLRIASKGIAHAGGGNGGSPSTRYARVGDAEQRRQGMYMIGQVAELRHEIVPVSALHHDVCAGGADLLAGSAAEKDAPAPRPSPSDVAIVGMACLLPKAGDLRAFWANVLAKRDAITEVPPDRWDWRLYFDEDRKAPDRIYSRWGGFLEDIPFDPLSYGMPPSTLSSVEPMQLLTLEVSRAALSDAGYLEREFDRARTSVIFGAGGGLADLGAQYAIRSHLPMVAPGAGPEAYARLPKWTEDSFAGILPNVAAGRVANRFDLGGVNFTVDAACASSLAAVHLAVRELETGNSSMVIVGGADTMQNPFTYLCFAKTQALSPRGRCRTFDADADGIVISEGLVAIVLKRLADAERDGDRIYAVIKGVGGSSDGRDRGLTAPRPEGQMRALERAYAKAGFSPATVGLFEAHGTGTVAGDLAEAQSLTRVLEAEGAKPGSCAVGSVKSMIGHTKCSAGVAGLMKIALALHDRILPPTINVEKPNPRSGFGTGPLYVNSETRPWIRPADHPRRAGVSAFGFGGTNFHAVLEEYEGSFLPAGETTTLRDWPSELFAWTGADRAGILARIEPWLRASTPASPRTLAELACAASRALAPDRAAGGALTLALVADSKEDLHAKLERAAAHLRSAAPGRLEDPRGIWFSDAPLARDGRIAFLFPGQGSQRPDMLRDLAVLFPEVRAAFERADLALAGKFDRPLSAFVFPRPRFTREEERDAMDALTGTRVAQPSLGAAGVALMALLDRLGVRPDLTAGHSYGEYLALHAAGRLDETALLSISEARGRAIEEASGEDLGTMAAVDAPAAQVEDAIRGIEGVVVANRNAPKQTIVSGTREAVSKALDRMEELELVSRPIRVACAFHSPLVAPARDRLASALSEIRLAGPRCEAWSNTLAARYPDDPAAAIALLADHLVKPVRFQEEIEAMHAAGARVFVEAGPGTVLTGLAKQILEGRDFLAVALDTPRRPGLLQLQHALAQLLAQGVPVRLDRLFEGRDVIAPETATLGPEATAPARPVWLVNGGGVRPAGEPRAGAWADVAQATREAAARPAASPGPAPSETPKRPVPLRPHEVVMTRDQDEAPIAPARPEEGVAPAAVDRAAVMLQHQQLMARFLETERNVMLAFLQGSARTPAQAVVRTPAALAAPSRVAPILPARSPERPADVPAGPSPAERPAIAAAPAAPGMAPPAAPSPNGKGARAAISLEEVTARLLSIVSERTGYPPDMLDLDLDLEADLGIDSIKRVEILGTFQAWDAVAGWKADEEFMEKVRTLKTLRSIAALLAETLRGGGPQAPSPPGPAAGPPPSGGGNGAAVRGNGHDHEVTGPMNRAGVAGTVPSKPAERRAAAESAAGRAGEGRMAPAPAFAIREVASDLGTGGGEATPALPKGAVVITDDENGIAEAMSRALIGLGARAVVIRLADPIERTLDRVRGTHGSLGAVIHLAPLARTTDFEGLDLDSWRARIAVEVKSFAALLRHAAPDLKDAASRGRALVLAATAGADSHPDRGAIAGLLKCLAWEWSDVRCRAVDLDAADAETQVRRLLAELAATSGGDVVSAWRGGRRVVFRPVPAPVDRTDEPIDSASVVLVTGGARGITAAIARRLAARAKPTIVLVGRSPLPPEEEPADLAAAEGAAGIRTALLRRAKASGARPSPRAIEAEVAAILGAREIRENLRAMRETGARIVYRQADARDASALGAVIEETYAAYGRIDGVVHGAGVIEDKLLEEKSPESFDRVFDTKADGAFLLARMLRPEGVRFLVFMSSVTAAFGNRGQADYGAANELLNHLAAFLDRRWPGRVVALDWGPWDSAGMASEEVKRQFAARGVQVIPPEAGCEALMAEIGAPKARGPVMVIGDGPWRDLPGVEDAAGAGPITPLLHPERLVSGRAGAMECLRVLDPDRDRYLHHHKLDGKPVLPAAAGLALMAEAAQKAWPDLVVTGARDVRVLRGMTLTGATLPIRIAVRAQTHAPSEAGDEIQAAVEITEADRPERACYRATILLGARLPEAPAARHPFLATLPPYPMPIGDAYRKWLFHGPVFQCVRRVLGVSEEGILAEIAPSRPVSCLEGIDGAARWTIDPVLVDGCLQLALLWVRAIHDVTGLPSRMRAVRRYAFDPGTPLTVSLRVLEGSGEANVRSDILCLTPEGRTALAIDGFEFTCTAALNRLVGWDESILPPSERGRP